MILASTNIINRGDPRWDPKLEGLDWDTMPASVLRYIARKYSEFSDGSLEMGTFPTTYAANRLREVLIFCLRQTGQKAKRTQARIAASMLMGLAEEGDWTP